MSKSKKLSDFRQQAMNANKHTERGMKALEASMNEVGYTAPMIAAADGEIIAGSARHETAANVFGADVEPMIVESDGKRPIVVVRTDIKNAETREAKRIGLLDNRVQQIDLDFDAEVLAQLYAEDKTLTAGLWSDDELTELLNEAAGVAAGDGDAEPQIDKAAELNKVWQVKTGDLWHIGEHRLLCGDSTKREDVERVMMGEKAEMMFTDPPYGVNYEGGHFHSGDVNIKRKREKLADDDSTAIYFNFLPEALKVVEGPCYMWFAGNKARDVYNAVFDAGCEVHALIIWHKTNATYAAMNAQYKQRHEPCLYFKPKGSTLRWCGATTEATVWNEDRDGINEHHPTQKPIKLAMKAIGNHSAKTIVDFFCGSGSTLVACQNLSRKCRAIELSPDYCAVILQRMKDAFPNIEIKRHE